MLSTPVPFFVVIGFWKDGFVLIHLYGCCLYFSALREIAWMVLHLPPNGLDHQAELQRWWVVVISFYSIAASILFGLTLKVHSWTLEGPIVQICQPNKMFCSGNQTLAAQVCSRALETSPGVLRRFHGVTDSFFFIHDRGMRHLWQRPLWLSLSMEGLSRQFLPSRQFLTGLAAGGRLVRLLLWSIT